MAKFEATLPTEILNDVKFIERNCAEIFGGMTKAGAEKAAENMRQRVSQSFRGGLADKVNSKLKVTKTYENKSKEIVTSAKYYGYISTDKKPFYLSQRGKKYGPYPGIPVTILMRLKEGGLKSSNMPAPFKKYWGSQRYRIKDPAFADTQGIRAAMLKAQKQLSGGLLDD